MCVESRTRSPSAFLRARRSRATSATTPRRRDDIALLGGHSRAAAHARVERQRARPSGTTGGRTQALRVTAHFSE
eukprot:5020590-Prymnesium_polylepis.1